MSPGRLVGDRAQSVPETVPTVRGKRPWFVNVEFWWRAPDARIEFPGWREGIFGRTYELNGADWVLDRAVAVQRAPDPGDQTWSEATGQAAADAAGSIGRTLLATGTGLGILALLWLLSKR